MPLIPPALGVLWRRRPIARLPITFVHVAIKPPLITSNVEEVSFSIIAAPSVIPAGKSAFYFARKLSSFGRVLLAASARAWNIRRYARCDLLLPRTTSLSFCRLMRALARAAAPSVKVTEDAHRCALAGCDIDHEFVDQEIKLWNLLRPNG